MPGLEDAVKTADKAYLKRWSTLLYSMPGAGKTTLAAQAPNALVIEVDRNGWIVLNNPLVPKTTRFIPLRKFDQIVKFIRALSKDPLLEKIDTIVIDTVSELHSLAQFNELTGDILAGKWSFNMHIYSVANFRTLQLLNEIFDLNKNVILCCHMKEEKVGEAPNVRVNIVPDLSDAFLADILALVDGAFFLAKDNETRRLRLQTEPAILTKSRFRKNQTLLNPTFSDLLPVLEELKEKPNE